MDETCNIPLQRTPRMFSDIDFSENGCKKDQGLQIFFCNLIQYLFFVKTSIVRDDVVLLGQEFQQCLFKPALEQNAIHCLVIRVGSNQFTRA